MSINGANNQKEVDNHRSSKANLTDHLKTTVPLSLIAGLNNLEVLYER